MGSTNTSHDAATLAEYSTVVSFVTSARAAVIVNPNSAGEVNRLVRLANEILTPLAPVSSGRSQFGGYCVTVTGGATVVDLNAIIRSVIADRPGRAAKLEPRMRFAELVPTAGKKGMRPNLCLLPSSTNGAFGTAVYWTERCWLCPSASWTSVTPSAALKTSLGPPRTSGPRRPPARAPQRSNGRSAAFREPPHGPQLASHATCPIPRR